METMEETVAIGFAILLLRKESSGSDPTF